MLLSAISYISPEAMRATITMMRSRQVRFSAAVLVALVAAGLFILTTAMTGKAPGTVVDTDFAAVLDRPAEMPPSGGKFAVIIGIVYPDYELGVIQYADRDAESVYNLLTREKGYPPENVKLLRNGEANRQNILSALDWLTENAGIDADSEVVFFYSGHGLRRVPEESTPPPFDYTSYALVPYDYGSFDYKHGQGLLWDRELAAYLGKLDPGSMWIGIDSCFSGGFIQPGIAGPNRVLTMSSAADQLSNEIDLVQRGVMTQLLVEEGLKQGLPLEEAFWNTEYRYEPEFGQKPQIADEYDGTFSFE